MVRQRKQLVDLEANVALHIWNNIENLMPLLTTCKALLHSILRDRSLLKHTGHYRRAQFMSYMDSHVIPTCTGTNTGTGYNSPPSGYISDYMETVKGSTNTILHVKGPNYPSEIVSLVVHGTIKSLYVVIAGKFILGLTERIVSLQYIFSGGSHIDIAAMSHVRLLTSKCVMLHIEVAGNWSVDIRCRDALLVGDRSFFQLIPNLVDPRSRFWIFSGVETTCTDVLEIETRGFVILSPSKNASSDVSHFEVTCFGADGKAQTARITAESCRVSDDWPIADDLVGVRTSKPTTDNTALCFFVPLCIPIATSNRLMASNEFRTVRQKMKCEKYTMISVICKGRGSELTAKAAQQSSVARKILGALPPFIGKILDALPWGPVGKTGKVGCPSFICHTLLVGKLR
jgi:hypothetical protein